MQNNKGITIITLAVTIIVLIILAGVSINMLVGDNGIIKKAQEAKENMESVQIEEQKNLNELYWQMDNGLDLGGDFSENNCTNCILIYTKEQLIAFRDRVNGGDTCEGKTIKLMSDIDLNGSESDQWIPMTQFAGIFDGNYHSIKNLYMNSDKYNYLSLFTELTETAIVRNLKIENCHIENTYHTLTSENSYYNAGNSVSAICAINRGMISNIWVKGSIKGYIPVIEESTPEDTRIRTHVAGLVSGNNYGYIQNCINEANLEGESLTVRSNGFIGTYVSGICNGNSGVIRNCYNTGNLKARGYNTEIVGGICAVAGDTNYISQEISCYNIGSIDSNLTNGARKRDGGIIGNSVEGRDTIINCHYLNTISTTLTWEGTTAQPENTMKSEAFVQTLGGAYVKDETNINNGYPILNWQLK